MDAQDAIAATHGAFAEAVRRGDAEAAAAVFAAGARLLPPTAQQVEGREAIAAYWRAGVETGLVDAALEEGHAMTKDEAVARVRQLLGA